MAVVGINHPTYARVVQFLYEEAALLDGRRFNEWLELMTPDVVYRAPVPLAGESSGADYATDGHFFYENLESLTHRVKRLGTGLAWAEDPASRTCRLISNVRVETEGANQLVVKSNFLLYRSRGDEPRPDLLAGERHDTLREISGQLKLARREVLLAQRVLGLPTLSFFL